MVFKTKKGLERRAYNESYLFFEEVSSGIYIIIKDRFEIFKDTNCLEFEKVIKAMNSEQRTAFKSLNKDIYSNFEIARIRVK